MKKSPSFEDLITEVKKEEFERLKGVEKIDLRCRVCGVAFSQTKAMILKSFKAGYTSGFCSRNCGNKFKFNQVSTQCKECQVPIMVRHYQKTHYKHNFCSYSCSAKYRNKHKTTGTIRSKLEIWLEAQIKQNYPDTIMIPNDRKLLGGLEIDFYFPVLKFGIELNGITHYEPIYGIDRLTRSLDSDKRKMSLCQEKGVELAVINVSQFKYFTDTCRETTWKEIENILSQLSSPNHPS